MASSSQTAPPPTGEGASHQLNLFLCSENLETSKGCSLETSQPSGRESNDAQPNLPPSFPSVEKNMSSAPEAEITMPPGWQNNATLPAPFLPAAAYVEKNIGISPATSPPAGWKDTIPEPNSLADSPPLEKMGSSEETTRPPGFENISPYQEVNIGSSAETARPPGFGNIEPHLEENIGSAAEATGPPGFENINSNPSFFSEKSTNTSPETSPPDGWEDTRSQPNPCAGSVDLEQSKCSSPETTRPSGWENIISQSNPHPGSLSTEKSMGSSPEKSRPPGWENVCSIPNPTLPRPEVGQMVCGSCRQLLSYPRGAMHVKCPCCQIINFVLEEHQVGNVKCGKCSVLLMYPYGAPCVRCSSCRFVTEIGAHNARPPLSVQQGRFSMPQNPVH